MASSLQEIAVERPADVYVNVVCAILLTSFAKVREIAVRGGASNEARLLLLFPRCQRAPTTRGQRARLAAVLRRVAATHFWRPHRNHAHLPHRKHASPPEGWWGSMLRVFGGGLVI